MSLYKFLIYLIFLLVSSSSNLAFIYIFLLLLFLKCLLASHLTLSRLSPLLWLRPCIHCILACFLWFKKRKHSLSNHSLCCFNPFRPRLSLADVLTFSLLFSQALFISSPSLKFSEAPNLFVISIWYYFITPSSFSFPVNLLCCFFTYCQSYPKFCNHQIMISVTVSSPATSYI